MLYFLITELDSPNSKLKVHPYGRRGKKRRTKFLLFFETIEFFKNAIEIDLNNQIAIRPTLGYYRIENEYNDDDFTTGVSLNIWFNSSVFGGISTTYALDEGDVTVMAGLGFGF